MALDLDACVQGDGNAWRVFVERFARVIFAAVRRTLAPRGRGEDTEDVAQDVFVRLVRNDFGLLRSYDPARSSLATWLTLVARSVAIDHLRHKRVETLPLADTDTPTPAAHADEASRTDLEIPENLLSPRQKLVLRLLFERGMTVPGAARLLRVQPQTIRSTKHKAIDRLRRFFGEKSRQPPPTSGDVSTE